MWTCIATMHSLLVLYFYSYHTSPGELRANKEGDDGILVLAGLCFTRLHG